MIYTPQPGTIPARVLAHLQTLPAGAELASAPLGEAIGTNTTPDFGPLLAAAVMHGAIVKRMDGRLAYWSLGTGVPLAADPDDAKPARRTVSAAPSTPAGPAPGPAQGQAAARPKPTRTLPVRAAAGRAALVPTPAVAKAVAAQPGALRVGVWSDGQVQIELSGQTMLLPHPEARQLCRFLLQLAPDDMLPTPY